MPTGSQLQDDALTYRRRVLGDIEAGRASEAFGLGVDERTVAFGAHRSARLAHAPESRIREMALLDLRQVQEVGVLPVWPSVLHLKFVTK